MTTYNQISYSSTTHNDTLAGYGIYCDNIVLYCDTEEYYCDGSVVMRDIEYDTTTYLDVSHVLESILTDQAGEIIEDQAGGIIEGQGG